MTYEDAWLCFHGRVPVNIKTIYCNAKKCMIQKMAYDIDLDNGTLPVCAVKTGDNCIVECKPKDLERTYIWNEKEGRLVENG